MTQDYQAAADWNKIGLIYLTGDRNKNKQKQTGIFNFFLILDGP